MREHSQMWGKIGTLVVGEVPVVKVGGIPG